MKKTFFNIEKEKREKVLAACYKEFSENTYDNASLNKIIKEAQISKGGLFKYIDSKKELYFYLLTRILEELMEYQVKHMDKSTECYIDRITDLAKVGFGFYKDRPDGFKIVMGSIFDRTSPVYHECKKIKRDVMMRYREKFLQGIDWDIYIYDRETVTEVVEFTLSGINQYVLSKMEKEESMRDMKGVICDKLKVGSEVLKRGLKKTDR